MVGLIWLIQRVHYPGFFFVDKAQFTTFATWHQKRISSIVIPIMVIELVSSVALCFFSTTYIWLIYLNMGIVALNLGVTFAVQVPIHKKLTEKMDIALIKRLVTGNWIRTALWSLRALLLLILLCVDKII